MSSSTKVSIRFSNEELLILKDMAAKENTTLSALCRNHILYGEGSGLAIREESVQQRVDEIENKIEVLGSILSEINQRVSVNHESLDGLLKQSVAAIALRIEAISKKIDVKN
jgi:hypothetical protein